MIISELYNACGNIKGKTWVTIFEQDQNHIDFSVVYSGTFNEIPKKYLNKTIISFMLEPKGVICYIKN